VGLEEIQYRKVDSKLGAAGRAGNHSGAKVAQ
jgi:hypothetical protein